MTKRKVANPLALAVLACLQEAPMHPYEIASTLRQRRKDDSIKLNYGSLYSVIEALKKNGLIEPVETLREGNRPERTVFRLTEPGGLELVDWLSELVSVPVKEYTQFEAGLSLIPLLPTEEAVRLLEERRQELELQVAQAELAIRKLEDMKLPGVFYIESRLRNEVRRAELAFTEKLIDEIRSGTLDGLDVWRDFHTKHGRLGTSDQ